MRRQLRLRSGTGFFVALGLGFIVDLYTFPDRVHGENLDDLEQTASEMKTMLERFATDRSALRRSYDIPMSALRADKMKRFTADWQIRLEKVDFTAMGPEGRIDYLLFRNLLRYQRDQFEREEERLSEVSDYLPGWKTIVALEEKRRKMEPNDPQQTAGILTDLTKRLLQTKNEFEANLASKNGLSLKKTHARRAEGRVGDLRRLMRKWFTFYNGYDPFFTWWIGEPYKELDSALEEYAAFLRKIRHLKRSSF